MPAMTADTEHIQVVWDRGSCGTAQAGSGCSIQVGPESEWTPEQLLIAAVESSLMGVFLGLATEAGLNVMGYVSAAGTIESRAPERQSIIVRPCVVIARKEDKGEVQRLLARAVELSPVVRALGEPVGVDVEVIVLESVAAP